MFWFVFSSKTATNLFLIIKYTAGNYPKVSLIWCVATNAALTAVKNVQKVFGCPTHSRSFHDVTLKTPGFVSTNMSQLPIQKKKSCFCSNAGSYVHMLEHILKLWSWTWYDRICRNVSMVHTSLFHVQMWYVICRDVNCQHFILAAGCLANTTHKKLNVLYRPAHMCC